jgi:hypothetical protein
LTANFELISVIVMSVTVIATAWSGCQNSQWSAGVVPAADRR